VDPAWIGFAGGVIGTVASAAIAVRPTRESARPAQLNGNVQKELARLGSQLQADLARLNDELEIERQKRIALLDRTGWPRTTRSPARTALAARRRVPRHLPAHRHDQAVRVVATRHRSIARRDDPR
jgi:hypothetical protein